MDDSNTSFISRHPGLARIFYIQVGLIVLSTVLVLIAYFMEQPFGFFWFSFLAGCIGASISVLKRSARMPTLRDEFAASWVACALPILYGGMMAAVAYLLFVSQILTGVDPEDDIGGLFTSNLFPVFTKKSPDAALTITTYIDMRVKDLPDLGKLLVWSFIAGYSETFVSRILGDLENKRTDG